MEKSRQAIKLLSAAAVLAAVFFRNSRAVTLIAFVCGAAAMLLLWKNLVPLSEISAESPKGKTLRHVTAFTALYIAAVAATAVYLERLGAAGKLDFLTENHIKCLLAILLAVPMTVLGNVAPKLPFNRYTGLRLPWTVRDEETWLIAHRVLGYVSFPLALLLFAQVPTDMSVDRYAERWFLGVVVAWIGIPGLISGWYYWKKYR